MPLRLLLATSMLGGELSGEQMLTRLSGHWRIDNEPNWAADVVLEDADLASLRGQAPAVLNWLRLLAYNLLALVRTHLPPKDGRPASDARTQKVLYPGIHPKIGIFRLDFRHF